LDSTQRLCSSAGHPPDPEEILGAPTARHRSTSKLWEFFTFETHFSADRNRRVVCDCGRRHTFADEADVRRRQRQCRGWAVGVVEGLGARTKLRGTFLLGRTPSHVSRTRWPSHALSPASRNIAHSRAFDKVFYVVSPLGGSHDFAAIRSIIISGELGVKGTAHYRYHRSEPIELALRRTIASFARSQHGGRDDELFVQPPANVVDTEQHGPSFRRIEPPCEFRQ